MIRHSHRWYWRSSWEAWQVLHNDSLWNITNCLIEIENLIVVIKGVMANLHCQIECIRYNVEDTSLGECLKEFPEEHPGGEDSP